VRSATGITGKVMIIVEENHGYGQIIGRPAAPYLNRLAAEYGTARPPRRSADRHHLRRRRRRRQGRHSATARKVAIPMSSTPPATRRLRSMPRTLSPP
jgi:hypothetical protein